jgi:predicted phosphoribosyltransferase
MFPSPYFENRIEAAERLAELLSNPPRRAPTVLALPRGGVPMAAVIAERLHAPWDLFVVRKVGAPGNPEYGLGAVTEGGTVLIDEERARDLGLGPGDLAGEIRDEQAEVARRVRKYRGDRPALPLEGRAVILVDDGLATGATARAAVRALRLHCPRTLTIAVGVASREAIDMLRTEVDEIVCPCRPPWFAAVGEWYREFDQVSDDEVMELLEREHARRPRTPTIREGKDRPAPAHDPRVRS